MAVIHILKDGSRISDIKGHVVKMADAEPLYRFIHSINSQKPKEKPKNEVRV